MMHLLFWETGGAIRFEDYYAMSEELRATYRASLHRRLKDRRKAKPFAFVQV